jgi:hypothetical protein
MIEDETIIENELLFTDADYPSNYVDCVHPEDYKKQNQIVYEKLFYIKSHHNRLLLRVSWNVDGGFIPMTFILDSGAPMYFYLSKRAQLSIVGRIQEDKLQNRFVLIDGKKALIEDSPRNYEKSNILGLFMLARLHLQINENDYELNYGHPIVF